MSAARRFALTSACMPAGCRLQAKWQGSGRSHAHDSSGKKFFSDCRFAGSPAEGALAKGPRAAPLVPRRLGPKRASKIRKLFALAKEDDVRKYVIRREIPAKSDDKTPVFPRDDAPS